MPRLQGIELRGQTAGVVEGPRVSGEMLGADQSGLTQLGQGIDRVGDVVAERETQSEISTVTARMAQAQAEWGQRIRKAADQADISSPSGINISEKILTDFDQFRDSFAGELQTSGAQRMFERSSSQLRAHLQGQAMSEQAELAGAKAKNDFVTAQNGLSSALMNDPSSFEFALGQQREGLQAAVQSGAMPSHVAMQLETRGKSELAKSAVRGWIQLSPAEAKAQLKGGAWDQYFDGDQKKQLFGEAQQALVAGEVEQQRLESAHRRALDAKQREVQSDFLNKMQAGSLSAKDILNSDLDAFGSGSKAQFLAMLKQDSQQQVTRTDGGLMRDLFSRIHLPDGDPNKITDENELNQYFGRGLSLPAIGQLRAEISGRRTEEGKIEGDMKKAVLSAAKSQLTRSNPLTGIKDPVGDEQYLRFQNYFLSTYKELRASGKSARALTDPDSPEYLGKAIKSYVRTSDQIMSDLAGGMRGQMQATQPAAAPRKEGESAADYLKRIGK